MDAWMRKEERRAAISRRRRPGAGRLIRLPFDGNIPASRFEDQIPTEIEIEATNQSGEAADWLTDHFWVDLLGQWVDEPIIVHFVATPGSVLHPVVVHQVHMLRRVADKWRVVGHCYAADLAGEGRVAQAAVSPYHELRIVDGARPGGPKTPIPRIEDVLSRMRAIQSAQNRTTPVLVGCSAPPTTAHQAVGSSPAPVAAGSLPPATSQPASGSRKDSRPADPVAEPGSGRGADRVVAAGPPKHHVGVDTVTTSPPATASTVG